MIPAELAAKILRLHFGEGWKIGTIATQLSIHHSVVRRVLVQAGVEEAKVTVRPSIVDPFLPFILQTLEEHPKLPASTLHQMVCQRGYPGKAAHFRHLVARLRPSKPAEAYLRLRTLAGEQGQVDWAQFGTLQIGRAARRLCAFVMVLSYSRRIFLRFFLDQRVESFLRGHVAAFEAFHGVPRVLLYDNLKSAVLERQGNAIRFNPTLIELASHYRFEPRPVAVARGNEKGRVERAIGYIRTAFWPGRRYHDLQDLNGQAEAWCDGLASDRKWPDDPTLTVRQAFDQERPHLLPLPATPFPTLERVVVHTHKVPYVRFDLNDYSIPHDNVERTLLVLADPEQVRVFDQTTLVATHLRSYDKGAQVEDPAHIQALVAHKHQARLHRGMDRLARAAPNSQALLTKLADRGLNLGSATASLLRLLDRYGATELVAAIDEALAADTPHPHAVRLCLERRRRIRGLPPPIDLLLPDDPRIRHLTVLPHKLERYDALARPQEIPDEHTQD